MSSGLSHVEFERDYYDSLLRSRSSMMRPWMLSCCSMPGDPSVPRRGPGHRAAERTQNLDSKVLFVLSSPQVTNKEKTEASRRKHGTWSCLIISNQISVSTNENSFWFFCYFHCRWPGDQVTTSWERSAGRTCTGRASYIFICWMIIWKPMWRV